MSLLTGALGIVDSVTASLKLQATVTFARYLRSDGYGVKTYGTPVVLAAVVEKKQKSIRTLEGELTMSTAVVTFVNLPALIAATPEVAGVSKLGYVYAQDLITLPDGLSPPILNLGGFVDGGSGFSIPTEVYLG